MGSQCETYQQALIDFYYGEKKMNKELKNHLENCEDCKKYWQDLKTVDENLKLLEFDPVVDYADIRKAFERYERRSTILDVLKFAVVGLLYSILMIFLFLNVKLQYFIYYQVFIYSTAPVLSFPIIYTVLKKSGLKRKDDSSHG